METFHLREQSRAAIPDAISRPPNYQQSFLTRMMTASSETKQDGFLRFFSIDLNSRERSRTFAVVACARMSRAVQIPSFLRAILSNKIEITACL